MTVKKTLQDRPEEPEDLFNLLYLTKQSPQSDFCSNYIKTCLLGIK